MSWVVDHHIHEMGHMFHVTAPFEEWLITRLNQLEANHFYILPNEGNQDVKVVVFHIEDKDA
jgi:hypothetical protein